jgi:diguanylate cyclase (GGDEF)-like protein
MKPSHKQIINTLLIISLFILAIAFAINQQWQPGHPLLLSLLAIEFIFLGIVLFLLSKRQTVVQDNNAAQAITVNDPQTGLFSHYVLEEILEHEVARAQRANSLATLICLGLDDHALLKQYGDEAIKHCAKIIQQNTRSGDYAFKLNKDTFLLYLNDCKPKYTINAAERFRKALEKTSLTIANHDMTFTVSIGIAASAEQYNHSTLLTAAQNAMQQAHSSGGNCSVLSDEIS